MKWMKLLDQEMPGDLHFYLQKRRNDEGSVAELYLGQDGPACRGMPRQISGGQDGALTHRAKKAGD